MFIGTKEAAYLLNISTQRVRLLIKEGRIQGARKINGRTWVIPLYRGMPRVSSKKRGPSPRWHSCRHCGKNTIHFNRPNIAVNKKEKNTDLDVLSAKRGTKTLARGHEIEIHSPCKIVYRPDQPHSCGATVWIETLATATMFNFDGKVEQVDSRWI